MGSASHPNLKCQKDDDIVHPLKKFLDKCNQFVAGSSPAAGAVKFGETDPSPSGDRVGFSIISLFLPYLTF